MLPYKRGKRLDNELDGNFLVNMLKLISLAIIACSIFQALCTETSSYAESRSQGQIYAESSSTARSQTTNNVGPPSTSEKNSDNDCNKKCSKPNEVYEICPSKCPFRTCGIDDTLIDCAPPLQPGDPNCPKPACRCKNQFFRDDKGNCVRWNQCPNCTKPNEVYDACDAPCPARRCDFDPTIVRCVAPPQVGDDNCVVGCRCIDGYLKDNNGVCVQKDQCAKCTKPNEVYDKCPDCSPQTCASVGQRYNCPLIPANKTGPNCKPECRCKQGFVRDNNHDCVPEEYCSKCTQANEVYDLCPDCSPQTCETMNTTCPYRPADKTGKICKPACRCKKGYYRNKLGECIAAEDCLKCQQPHEYFSCGGACDNVCETLSKQNQTSCPIRNIMCNKMCYCEKGYARAKNNTCIPFKDCQNECKKNERFDECPVTSINPETCEEAGFPLIRKERNPDGSCPGKPGCVCEDGFLRDISGKCIPSEECPSCGGDVNATLGCGVNCGRTCDLYNSTEQIFCIQVCYTNACDCRQGHVYDGNLQKCVLPENCTPVCKINEVYSTCANKKNTTQSCSNKGKTLPSGKPVKCRDGCICKDGYLRASNGTCVPEDQCDVCPKGEIFSDCPPVKCDGEYCPRTRDDLQNCPFPKKCGTGRCICEFNKLRDRKTGRCIPYSDCPEFKCNRKNEVFVKCPPICPGEQCSDYLKNATCPRFRIGIVVPCTLGCRCIDRHYRDNNGDCVTGDECKALAASTPSPPTQNCNTSTDVEKQRQALELGNTKMTGKFFYQVVKLNPAISIIVSVFSVLIPLAQLALYSKGKTNQELMSALNLNTKEDIRCAFPALLAPLKSTESTELDLADRIYVKDSYKLSDSFKNDTINVFNAQAESINFDDPDKAANIINKWVSEVTKGKIDNLVAADMFDSTTRLVLANAIYFKSIWKTEFNPNNTRPRDFYKNSNQKIQVDTMQLKGKFKYGESSDLDAQILELPYKDEDISFVVFLPKKTDGLLALAEKMQDSKVLTDAINGVSEQTVNILLPKIDVSTTTNLIDILELLGIKTIFSSTEAELSGMIVPNEPLYVSDAIQKSTVTADEKGSVAAAANAVVVSTKSLPIQPPVAINFNADHPFAYLIKIKNLIIFCGTFV